jgi:hypothetical protein
MTTTRDEESKLSQVIDWLRAGYPEGIPPTDYIPLVALLRKSLSPNEVDQVIGRLLASRPDAVAREDVHAAIQQVTSSAPTREELHMVAAKLAAGGWPLVGFDGADQA